jgi:murein DD-endopeptidase MepM/ murein hydrolase activator NlpD
MKCLVSTLALLFSISCFSQLKTKLYNEKFTYGYNILVDNDEFCPISMKIDLELTNLSSSNGNHKIFVIPARTKGFIITKLEYIKVNSGGGFKTKSAANYGDSTTNLAQLSDYHYSLPFRQGETIAVHQGYNGSFSHQNENSLDFTMPVGSEIYAARDGVVVKVVENNTQSCPERSCAAYNNLILIYHKDGTFSQYVHLKQNGAEVEEGDIVKENELIGYSGQTGWANGPHLHFMVFIQRIDKQQTLKTKFKINYGTEVQYLREKAEYVRNY